MPLQPLSDTITVQFDDAPPTGDEPGRPKVQSGIVVQVGPGLRSDGNALNRSNVRPGDRVFFAADSGALYAGEEGSFLMVRERDVLAVDRAAEEEEVPLYVPRPPRTD